MKLEFYDTYDNHYKELDTDEIFIDGKSIDRIKREAVIKFIEWLDEEECLGEEVYDAKHCCLIYQRLLPNEIMERYRNENKYV